MRERIFSCCDKGHLGRNNSASRPRALPGTKSRAVWQLIATPASSGSSPSRQNPAGCTSRSNEELLHQKKKLHPKTLRVRIRILTWLCTSRTQEAELHQHQLHRKSLGTLGESGHSDLTAALLSQPRWQVSLHSHSHQHCGRAPHVMFDTVHSDVITQSTSESDMISEFEHILSAYLIFDISTISSSKKKNTHTKILQQLLGDSKKN